MIKVKSERKPVTSDITVLRVEIDREAIGRGIAIIAVLGGFLHFTAGVI